MKRIAEFFIENSKFTVILSFAFVVYGIIGVLKMSAESFPNVSLASATVITSYEGASAEDIETKITKPLEDEIRTISGLKDVRSTSQSGLSNIVVRVDMDDSKVDVSTVMNDIQKAIDRTTDLPKDLREAPKFTELKSEEFPVIEIAVVGDNADRKRDIIADFLKDELEDNQDIKNVRLAGFALRAFHIYLDNNKILKNHISINEVLDKIRSRNLNTPGGELKSDTKAQLVRVEGKIQNKAELENIVIRSNFTGQTIYLKDIARIVDGEEELTTIARHNGESATLVIVTKKAGKDTINIVDDVNKKLESFKKRFPDFEYHIYNNEGLKVKNRVAVLLSNAWSGLILVIIFLFFFLPGKIGFSASLSLPLAVMGTMGMMPNLGMNIDTITILALVIALGMLVDNSVVISENYSRLRQDGIPPRKAAIDSIASLWLPITGTALTTIAAFLPMLVTKGVMGQFIRWIPIVVTISLILSLVESFFLLPMRLVYAGKKIKKKVEGKNADWFVRFEHKFENIMTFLIKKRYFVLGIFTAIIIFSFFMMTKANKFILFPAEQTEVYVGRVETPRSTRLEHTNIMLRDISKKIKEHFGDRVKHIVSRAGTSQTRPNDPKAKTGSNVGLLTIYVDEYTKLNTSHIDFLKELRDIKYNDEYSIQFEALVNGPPVGNPIEATFRSNSVDDLYKVIEEIKAKLSTHKGIYDLAIDDVYGEDETFVHIDYIKADRLGLDANNISQTLKTAIGGNRVSTVVLNNKDVDLIVRFDNEFRREENDLRNVSILDNRGNLVPLSTFATIETHHGSPQIKRFDFKRAKTLTGEVNDNIITSYEANLLLKNYFNELQGKYSGVSLIFGGAAESTKESMESLFQALILSLIGISALLVFLFKSYIRPLIIMTTIPLGLLGFSVAFYFHERPISFLALIGIIGLGGIIVNSGIVLISFIDNMREEGKLTLDEILVKASGLRLRAVLVTSLTTISGLLPTAYGIGGNDAILIPMTLAMAWGLTSGTILTLMWVPCADAIIEDFNKLIEKIFKLKDVHLEAN